MLKIMRELARIGSLYQTSPPSKTQHLNPPSKELNFKNLNLWS
jgi:hypothetical protein